MSKGSPPLLVGRDRQLARLRGALDRAAAGQRAVIVIAGESGIGKTELIRAATADRPLVAWGTCVEGAGVAGYWAWSCALEQLARQLGADEASRLAGEDAALLATIAPVFGEPLSGEATARDRLLLFDAVNRWLDAAATAATAPAIIVLDDLHWADDSTISLTDFVARSPRPAPLAVIVSYRPEELRRAARAHLARLASVAEHIELGGLDHDAVSSLVATVAGPTPQSAVDEIYRRGGGHPVFTRELALLGAYGSMTAIPGAVRDLIDHRIRRLPEPSQQLLEVAALVGNDVHPDVLSAVLGVPQPDIGPACAPALQAGIFTTRFDSGLRFAHDLYRETLADSIQVARRPALHQAIATALEDRHARGGEVSAAELARHFCDAMLVDGPVRAATWTLAAAATDRESLAFTEAARQLAAAAGRDGGVSLDQARAVYQRLGAAGWVAEVDHERRTWRGEPAARLLRRHGRTWQITFNGQQATLPHSKGIADLAVLLAKPGRDIHVLDLYGSPDRSGPAGKLADRRALDAYRQRLRQLDDEIEHAVENHDLGRQTSLDQEKQALLTELRRVARPGNQSRQFASYPAERARKAVAARLRDTIRKLRTDLPDLAVHLDQAIATGTYCRYRAGPDDAWHIQADDEQAGKRRP